VAFCFSLSLQFSTQQRAPDAEGLRKSQAVSYALHFLSDGFAVPAPTQVQTVSKPKPNTPLIASFVLVEINSYSFDE
jgi:hypothetical protein